MKDSYQWADDIFRGRASPWDNVPRLMRALHAAKAGAEELRRKWPKNDPDGLAVAIGALRASFGA